MFIVVRKDFPVLILFDLCRFALAELDINRENFSSFALSFDVDPEGKTIGFHSSLDDGNDAQIGLFLEYYFAHRGEILPTNSAPMRYRFSGRLVPEIVRRAAQISATVARA